MALRVNAPQKLLNSRRADRFQRVRNGGERHVKLRCQRQVVEVHLLATADTAPDPGGSIDRSVLLGAHYRYTAQRMLQVTVDGKSLTLRSVASAPVAVAAVDTFPPEPPTGLETAAGGGDTPSIDLSWRPDTEADLAGYNVYRRTEGGGDWERLNHAPIAVPAYTDKAVSAGQSYTYRVTAVDSRGNESAPGAEVQETPGTR